MEDACTQGLLVTFSRVWPAGLRPDHCATGQSATCCLA